MIILIFGDSVAYGCWDEEGGWVDRLRRFTNKKYLTNLDNAPNIYNLSISGETTEGILLRFEAEAKQRISTETIIIFAVGINDSEFLNDKKEFLTPPAKFEANIDQLTEKAKKFSSKIVFIGLNPVDDSKVDPIPWLPANSYKNDYIEKFNEIIKKECAKNGVDFIEIFEKMGKMNYQKLLIDGVHPNTEGHKVIFEIVKEYLVKKLLI